MQGTFWRIGSGALVIGLEIDLIRQAPVIPQKCFSIQLQLDWPSSVPHPICSDCPIQLSSAHTLHRPACQ